MKNIFNMFVVLLLLVIFVYSTQIAFGINDAKNYYFQLVMIFGIGLYGIGLYKEKNIEFQKYSLFDYMLVLTIIYLSLRTSPFIDEFLNFQLFIILYFVIKQGMFDSKYQYKMVLINNNCMCFIVILELIVILQSFIGLFQAYGIFESLNPRYKITGTTVNPAYYSFFLAASYPLILSIHIYLSISIYRNIKLKILTYIAFLCSVSVLIITENRSSWVSLVLSSIFLLLCIKSFRVTIKTIMLSRILKIISFMITVFCLVIGIVFVYNFKYDSSYGRLLIWKISNSMIFENPIFGIGYNKFEVLYNIYQQKYFSNNDFLPHDVQIADYIQVAYNEYLQLLIETGIIGFLLFVIIIVYFFMQLLKYINRTSVDENCDFHYFVNIGLFISITSILIMSLFSYPLHYLPVRIIFIINIAILSGLMKNKMRKKNWCVSSIKFIYLFLICLLIMNSLSNVGYKKMWKLAIKEYDKGNYSQSCSIYQAIYPRMKTNGLFLLYYGTTLNICADYDSSIRILEDAKEYISDPVLFIKLGDSYRNRKQYELAEQNYLFAADIVPNRLYPYFLLALLYSDENYFDLPKFDKMSNFVLSFEPKINSQAICEMKDSVAGVRNSLFCVKSKPPATGYIKQRNNQ